MVTKRDNLLRGGPIDGASKILSGGGKKDQGGALWVGAPVLYAGATARSPRSTLVELPDGRRVVVPATRWRFLRRKGGVGRILTRRRR